MLGPEPEVQTASRAPRTAAPSGPGWWGGWSSTHLPVEPITSLSWRWVGARGATEQFLGMRESLAQN